MTRLTDIMAQAQRILNSLDPSTADLHDKGTDRLLADLDQPSIVAEADRLTSDVFPDRAARLAAEANARAVEKHDDETPLVILGPGGDFTTNIIADESGASAGAGGGR